MDTQFVFKDYHGIYRLYPQAKFRFVPAGALAARSLNPVTMELGRSHMVTEPPRFFVDSDTLLVVRGRVERVRALDTKYEATIVACDDRIAELAAELALTRTRRQEALAEAFRNSKPVSADVLIGKGQVVEP